MGLSECISQNFYTQISGLRGKGLRASMLRLLNIWALSVLGVCLYVYVWHHFSPWRHPSYDTSQSFGGESPVWLPGTQESRGTQVRRISWRTNNETQVKIRGLERWGNKGQGGNCRKHEGKEGTFKIKSGNDQTLCPGLCPFSHLHTECSFWPCTTPWYPWGEGLNYLTISFLFWLHLWRTFIYPTVN